jgi:hypothetical protein
MGGISMNKDPIKRATDLLIQNIDDAKEIEEAIKDLTESYKYQINILKGIIKEYFSDLQSDETISGAMRRLQIRKELLDFANK